MFTEETAEQFFTLCPEPLFIVDGELKKVHQGNKAAELLIGMNQSELHAAKFDQLFAWNEFGFDPFSDMGKKNASIAAFKPAVLQNRKVGAIPVLAAQWNVSLAKGKTATALLVRDARPLRAMEGGSRTLQARIAELEEKLENAVMTKPVGGKKEASELGDIIHSISRYFNDLATVIMGSAGLVRGSIGAANVNQVHLKSIEDASGRLSGLIQQLLTYVGRVPMQRIEVRLDPMMDELVRELNLNGDTRIQFKLSINPKANTVLGDPNLLKNACKIIVSNALEAMPHGGMLTIESSPAEVEDNATGIPPGLRTGQYVKLKISDTGLGMDEVTQSKAGQPFITTKKIAGRPGLGLSSLSGIIRMHDGGYSIQSAQGKGTTVTLWLRRE